MKTTTTLSVLMLVTLGSASCALSVSEPNTSADDRERLVHAMRSTHLILHEYAPNFRCDYEGYVVVDSLLGAGFTVELDSKSGECRQMVDALNRSDEYPELQFMIVSAIEVFVPRDRERTPPQDLTLIHEINPKQEH